MPAKKKVASPAPAKTLEVQLWDAANKMRGAVPPTDYMHVCLGLVFLRYLSVASEKKHAELLETPIRTRRITRNTSPAKASGFLRRPAGPRSTPCALS